MISAYASQTIKRAILLGQPLMIEGMFAGLLTGDKGSSEVSYLGYERQQVVFDNVVESTSYNANSFQFPVPPVSFEATGVFSIGLFDARADGNWWMTLPMMRNGNSTGVVVANQAPIVVQAGTLQVDML